MSRDIKIWFIGGVENGKLKLSNRKQFDKEIAEAFNGKRVQGYIMRSRKTRTLLQNSYYHAVIIPYVKQGLTDVGNLGLHTDDIHNFLKNRFLEGRDIVIPKSGEVVKLVTTTTLSTTEMKDYFEQISLFAAEFLGVTIPEPDPLFNAE